MKQYVIVADLDRCIGCYGGCQVACKMEHEIGLGPSRSKLYNMGPTGVFPNLQMYFLPVMCQQCENPSCVAACSTGACYKDEADGIIKINTEVCVGCGLCKNACPYDAIIMNKETGVADKCDVCITRIQAGEEPACVRNCSGRALLYGDINDPESEVSKALQKAEGHLYSLKDCGNQPSGKFILKGADWIDVLPQEFTTPQGGRHGK